MKNEVNVVEDTSTSRPFPLPAIFPLSLLGILLLVLLLPPFGILITGYELPESFTIFPIPIEPGTSSIFWPAWVMVALFTTITIAPSVWRFFQYAVTTDQSSQQAHPFPWWGWLAILWTASSWMFAWTRFSWVFPFQPHTFPLLWFGYIVTLNALSYQRSRTCLIVNRPRFTGYLFLLSAGFWWTFEYLNQFVKNWHYVNVPDTSDLAYIFFTSLAFSTVLPAVLSTYEWLTTFPRLTKPFENWYPLPWLGHRGTGWMAFSVGALGLSLIGLWPTLLFPVLWLSPLMLLLGIQFLRKKQTCFHLLGQGDWRPVMLSALAALVCGFWWEIWNAYSLVHWEYTIPFVHALKIFEMPVLGYAGYLPFGLLCLVITEVGLGYRTNRPWIEESQTWRGNAP
ncbi:MAG: hypothetical protein OEY57_09040 [Nitrospirota bacterium]|nr:hypothetical protein [Nitrospirota bacterium]